MHLCWVNMDAARKLFKKDPSFEEANVFFCLWTVPADLDGFQALVHHVVAVATDDKRYLWSLMLSLPLLLVGKKRTLELYNDWNWCSRLFLCAVPHDCD